MPVPAFVLLPVFQRVHLRPQQFRLETLLKRSGWRLFLRQDFQEFHSNKIIKDYSQSVNTFANGPRLQLRGLLKSQGLRIPHVGGSAEILIVPHLVCIDSPSLLLVIEQFLQRIHSDVETHTPCARTAKPSQHATDESKHEYLYH